MLLLQRVALTSRAVMPAGGDVRVMPVVRDAEGDLPEMVLCYGWRMRSPLPYRPGAGSGRLPQQTNWRPCPAQIVRTG